MCQSLDDVDDLVVELFEDLDELIGSAFRELRFVTHESNLNLIAIPNDRDSTGYSTKSGNEIYQAGDFEVATHLGRHSNCHLLTGARNQR